MIGCAVFWYKSNLAFAQDIVLGKEVQKSGIHNTTEKRPPDYCSHRRKLCENVCAILMSELLINRVMWL